MIVNLNVVEPESVYANNTFESGNIHRLPYGLVLPTNSNLVTVVGSNGTGKSTLLRTILSYVRLHTKNTPITEKRMEEREVVLEPTQSQNSLDAMIFPELATKPRRIIRSEEVERIVGWNPVVTHAEYPPSNDPYRQSHSFSGCVNLTFSLDDPGPGFSRENPNVGLTEYFVFSYASSNIPFEPTSSIAGSDSRVKLPAQEGRYSHGLLNFDLLEGLLVKRSVAKPKIGYMVHLGEHEDIDMHPDQYHILLIDEPENGLDLQSQKRVCQMIDERLQDGRTQIFVVTQSVPIILYGQRNGVVLDFDENPVRSLSSGEYSLLDKIDFIPRG